MLLRFYLSIFWYLCIIFCQNNPLKGCQDARNALTQQGTVSHLDQYPWRHFHKARRSCQAVVDLDKCQPHTSAGSYQSHTHVQWQGSSRFQVGAIGTMMQNDIPTWSTFICPTLLRHMLTTQNSKTCFWKCMENALKMWNTSKIKIWNTTHHTQFLTLVLENLRQKLVAIMCVFHPPEPYAEYMSPNRS